MKFIKLPKILAHILGIVIFIASCKQVELYEKLENIPKAAWESDFKPSFTFNISDTLSLYNVFVTIRHTNSYAYNNIWMDATLQMPGDSVIARKLDLALAGTDGWLGTGMDDIFERRIKIAAGPQRFKKGAVTFTLQQAMRQNPLPGIMQVGIRVERAN